MDSELLIADLKTKGPKAPTISFADIVFSAAPNDSSHEVIKGFHGVSIDQAIHGIDRQGVGIGEKYAKALSKGQRVTDRVVQLLTGALPAATVQHHLESGSDSRTPSLRVRKASLVGGPPCEGHAKELEGTSSYQKLEFDFEPFETCPQPLRSGQLLHFSCPSLKAEASLFPRGRTSDFDNIHIVSGVCLFSARLLQQSLNEPTSFNIERLHQAKPTLYEMEYIARSSTTVADIASLVILRRKTQSAILPRKLDLTIHLDVPSFHYYQSIDDKIQNGVCSAEVALQWMKAIESRCDQIGSVFRAAVMHELSKRGVAVHQDLDVEVTPRHNIVASSINDALQKGQRPYLNEILLKLYDQHDGLWRLFYDLIPPKERPRDFRALGYLFYVYQVVRPALAETASESMTPLDIESSSSDVSFESDVSSLGSESQRPRVLLISIDDGAERRIYSRSQKTLKKIRGMSDGPSYPTLVEIYMSRRVFIDANEAGSNLYLDDPAPDKITLESDTVIRHEMLEREAGTVEMEPSDIVRNLYGIECAKNLDLWFTEFRP